MKKTEKLEIIRFLIKNYLSEEEFTLDKSCIESILFEINEDGTKSITKEIFELLKIFKFDMNMINFNNAHISGLNFSGLRNVKINIDKIPNKDLRESSFNGVKLIGSLYDSLIKATNFEGYIGFLVLDPQKLKEKDLRHTNLSNVTIVGSLDDVDIRYANFENAKGKICINPQLVKDKKLNGVSLKNIYLIGDMNENTKEFKTANFDGCEICQTNFEGHKGNVIINPQTIFDKDLMFCDFSGVVFSGSFDGTDIYGASFKDSVNAQIDISKLKSSDVSFTDLTDAQIIQAPINIMQLTKKKKRKK